MLSPLLSKRTLHSFNFNAFICIRYLEHLLYSMAFLNCSSVARSFPVRVLIDHTIFIGTVLRSRHILTHLLFMLFAHRTSYLPSHPFVQFISQSRLTRLSVS